MMADEDAKSLRDNVVSDLHDVLAMIPDPESDEPLPPDTHERIVERLKSIRDGI